jgi:hypothetical protein
MSFRTSITIVASPRPRVGKTLLARVVSDFHHHEGHPVAAYDLNAGDETLADFLPWTTLVSSINDIRGEMAVFDALVAGDDVHRVVDIGHTSFANFFDLAERIGFADEAHARGIVPLVLYLLTPDRTSVEAFHGLRRRMPGVTLVPVHNEIFGATQHRDRYALAADDTVVRLPLLAAGLRRYVEAPPFSFADELPPQGMPPHAFDELQRWVRKMHVQFRQLYLRGLLADLRSALSLAT